ncbi:MAG: nucleotidyltransferase domain-containing protein [Candidatus Pacearchaeota archaeon]|nr:nucleotidyltransferase domain-containing protein [Candidatus Pacearchaeota archaeon]
MNFLEKIKEKIRLDQKREREIDEKIKDFLKNFKKKVEIRIGGSFAKKTLLNKKILDIDLFFVFPKNEKDPSKKLEKILKEARIKATKLKGSRDYFQVRLDKNIFLELVPLKKIKKVEEAENVTDVSLFHINYVLKKIKENPKLRDEIRLAKAFCHACNCYGAESYIRGFSGYALEVLVSYYGSFLNFIRNASKWKKQVIIDPEKHYKNKKEILEKLNYAKITSPIVLIDPVQASRNLTAAIAEETFENFVNACKEFLKNPSENFFFKKKQDIKKWKNESRRRKAKFFVVDVFPFSEKKDIAGAKSKKFFDFICKKAAEHEFKILKKNFEFNENKLKAKFYFIIKEPKKFRLVKGPPVFVSSSFLESFKKKWSSVFVKNGTLYAKTERKIKNFSELIKEVKKQAKEMKIRKVILRG